jgi:perosamine synthetase
MESIDKSGLRVAMIIDADGKLIGIATDGDIRRALVSGMSIETKVAKIMNKKPITANIKTAPSELLKIMIEKGIHEIPLIDDNGLLADVALAKDLRTIPLSSPDITHKEVEAITQVLSTSYLSIGPKAAEFEKKMANYIGVKYGIAVNSGTSALHLCIRSLDIKDDDEVITTPFSFIASANCVLFERAKPVFVDIDKNTLCIDADKIEEKITKNTKAILPVHIFGHSCDMDKIIQIAKKHNLAVIEDACEALGAEYKNTKVGTFGDIAVFAFYPNKQITTGEGGMVLTNNEKIAELCRSMRNQGRDENEQWLVHARLGYNYRMSELGAALGVAQIDRVEEILEKRQFVAEMYNRKLTGIKGVKIPYIATDVKISWFVYVIQLDGDIFTNENRNTIIYELRQKGISCREYFPAIHLQPFYVKMANYKRGDFLVTESVSDLSIALPFYNSITEADVDYVCESLREVVNRIIKR